MAAAWPASFLNIWVLLTPAAPKMYRQGPLSDEGNFLGPRPSSSNSAIQCDIAEGPRSWTPPREPDRMPRTHHYLWMEDSKEVGGVSG